jgi:prenyltransferase beta subunit
MIRVARLLVVGCLAVLSSLRAQAQPPADRLTESVDRGLAFLALLQEKDGAWLANGAKHPAVTSLAVMAFLSAGHVPGEGPYQANVEKGIRWILTQQQPNGVFAMPGWEEMYQHGICTLMLSEVAAMSDAKTSRQIKPKLESAVKRILLAQRTQDDVFKGGWRYRLDSTDADISVTGWQIMALRAARNLGCDVPAERIDLAMRFIRQCRDNSSGGFCYMPGGSVSHACTGTCVLALELQGKAQRHSREALQGGSYLLKNPLRPEHQHFHYASYYTAQAMFQLGNNYWNVYRPHLHQLLLDSQQRNGSWLTNDAVGTTYSTALSLLALTVEYRLLPIYQGDEEQPATEAR